MLVLTSKNCQYKPDIHNLTTKMTMLNKNTIKVFEDIFAYMKVIHIDQFVIFSIHTSDIEPQVFNNDDGTFRLIYIEINHIDFISYLANTEDEFRFSNINHKSLYIFRGGNYRDVKNLFNSIEGYKTIVGRNGSQKSHMLSPLESRLNTYLMLLCFGDYQLMRSLNTYHSITKDKYLLFTTKF